MYSDYGALGVDCQMLANLHQYHQMGQTASMTSNWLGVLPTSKSHWSGNWRSSMGDLQKRHPIVMKTARCQRLNPNVIGDETVDSSLCRSPRRRRRDTSDDGQERTDQATNEFCAAKRRTTVVNRRRFDFTRLAESATRRDDSSPTSASDTEITASKIDNRGVKVVKYDDDDQSDRRLSPQPAAVSAETADRQSLKWPLPHHSSTLQPLKSIFNPIESYDRYLSSAPFDDKMIRHSVISGL